MKKKKRRREREIFWRKYLTTLNLLCCEWWFVGIIEWQEDPLSPSAAKISSVVVNEPYQRSRTIQREVQLWLVRDSYYSDLAAACRSVRPFVCLVWSGPVCLSVYLSTGTTSVEEVCNSIYWPIHFKKDGGKWSKVIQGDGNWFSRPTNPESSSSSEKRLLLSQYHLKCTSKGVRPFVVEWERRRRKKKWSVYTKSSKSAFVFVCLAFLNNLNPSNIHIRVLSSRISLFHP